VVGGRKLGSKSDMYKAQEYDLETIGAQPQEGKGLEKMGATVEIVKARGPTGRSFSGEKLG